MAINKTVRLTPQTEVLPPLGETHTNLKESKDMSAMLRAFGFLVNCSHLIHAVPYRYDSKRQLLVVDTRWRYKLGFVAHSLFVLAYAAHLIAQSARALLTGDIEEKYKMRLFMVTAVFTLYAIGPLIAWNQLSEFPAVFNHVVNTERYFRAKYHLEVGSKKMKRMFNVLAFYAVLMTAAPRDMLEDPQAPQSLSSLLPKEVYESNGLMLLIPVFLVQAGAVFTIVSLLVRSMMVLLFLVSLTVGAIELMKSDLKEESVRRIHSVVSILERICTPVLGPWLLHSVVLFVVAIISSLFIGISKGYWLSFGASFVWVLILKGLTSACSQQHEESSDLSVKWAGAGLEDGAAFTKWRRACRPFRVPIGRFAYFDRGIMLTFVDIILNNTVSLILANR